ncbi:hypothetical protein GY45DRAFT_1318195 [Cubamyces sp. BRFM 1775]|nr:hypothetical protein GY45DRAFT_1318195 [Cubamyces sp. BRFM 1775]
MQFSAIFYTLAAFAAVAVAVPTTSETGTFSAIISDAEMAHWLANTDAELTFIGEPFNPLLKRSAQTTTVTYCTKRVGPICGGSCSVYQGGATCLATPGTVCIAATNDIGFCDAAGCNGDCSDLASCGTGLNGGFCYTPGTASILVSTA